MDLGRARLQDSAIALTAPSTDLFYFGTANTFLVSVDGGRHRRPLLNRYFGYGVGVMDFGCRHGWALLADGSLGDGPTSTNDGSC